MSNKHTIRLRGPWEVTSESAGTSRRVVFPTTWRAVDETMAAAAITLRRKFGQPTGLTSTDRVALVVADIEYPAELHLNEAPLGTIEPGGPARFEIAARLDQRNELTLRVCRPEIGTGADGSLGDFSLEIQPAGN